MKIATIGALLIFLSFTAQSAQEVNLENQITSECSVVAPLRGLLEGVTSVPLGVIRVQSLALRTLDHIARKAQKEIESFLPIEEQTVRERKAYEAGRIMGYFLFLAGLDYSFRQTNFYTKKLPSDFHRGLARFALAMVTTAPSCMLNDPRFWAIDKWVSK